MDPGRHCRGARIRCLFPLGVEVLGKDTWLCAPVFLSMRLACGSALPRSVLSDPLRESPKPSLALAVFLLVRGP